MNESTQEWCSDAALAAEIAEGAGRLLINLQKNTLLEGKALGAAGDAMSQAYISRTLQRHRPQDAVLSEEAADDPSRIEHSRVWIVDPLDGTREYSEHRTDWAVHVALAIDGTAGPGAVALPGLNLTLRTDRPPLLADASDTPLRMLVSRTRPAPQALAIAKQLHATLVPMGSAGAKAMAVVRGEADIYLHAGGQYEWDSCAPVAVAQAAGLHVSRIDGSACCYNRVVPYMPDLLICRPELAPRLLAAIREITATCGSL